MRYPTAARSDTASTDTTTSTIRRATLTIQVAADPDDSALARLLGWTNGIPPHAEVEVKRAGSSIGMTDTTDAAGMVSFANVLEGSYSVSSVRILDSADRAMLPDSEQDVDAFGGARTVAVRAPATSTTVALSAGRRGSLVISEVFGWNPYFNGQDYLFNDFVELYNNADTTIYLDGKVIGDGQEGWFQSPNFPCSLIDPYVDDSLGVWTVWLDRFPGSGREYPLPPGGIVVVATDAVDHTKLFPEGVVDLSKANFEFIGTGDTDNPDVPNMIELDANPDVFGHGLRFENAWDPVYVANPIDVASLPSHPHPWLNRTLVRVPNSAILDIVQPKADLSRYPDLPPYCTRPPVNPRLDAAGFLYVGQDGFSEQRRVLGTLPNGRPVLLRTRNSSRDLISAPATPFRVQ